MEYKLELSFDAETWFSGALHDVEPLFGRTFSDHGSGMCSEDAGFWVESVEELEQLLCTWYDFRMGWFGVKHRIIVNDPEEEDYVDLLLSNVPGKCFLKNWRSIFERALHELRRQRRKAHWRFAEIVEEKRLGGC